MSRSHVRARSVHVARGELHRTFRSIRDSPREAIGVLVLALFVVAYTAGAVAGAYFLGRGVRTGASYAESILPAARAGVGFAWLVLATVVTFRTFAKLGKLEQSSLLLTSVPIRELVYGKLLAEGVGIGSWLLAPITLATVAFAAGARTPAVVLAMTIVAVLVMLSAVGTGFVVGMAITHVATRYDPVVRVKTPLVVALTVGYLAIFVFGWVDGAFAVLYDVAGRWPVGWLADALFLAVPAVDVSGPYAAAGPVLTAVLAAGTLAAAPRVAAYHWLSDPPHEGDEQTTRTGSSRVESLLAPIATRPTRAVATVVWRRTWRSPIRLVYLIYPAFVLITPAQQTVESLRATGTVPAGIPPLVMAYAVWAAGMAFTLNPLGDQGATLQTTVSIPDAARAIVRGRVLIATLTMVPLAAVLVATVALAGALPVTTVATLVVATAFGAVATIVLSTGIGVAFPRFGTVSVTRNREVVVPGKAAAAIYSVAALLFAAALALVAYEPAWGPIAALVSFLLSAIGPFDAEVSVTAVRAVGALLLLPLTAAPVYSYRYAVRRVGRYRLE